MNKYETSAHVNDTIKNRTLGQPWTTRKIMDIVDTDKFRRVYRTNIVSHEVEDLTLSKLMDDKYDYGDGIFFTSTKEYYFILPFKAQVNSNIVMVKDLWSPIKPNFSISEKLKGWQRDI